MQSNSSSFNAGTRLTASFAAVLAIAICTTAILATPARAVMIAPSELTLGSNYQIAFVTKGARDAFSSDITTYNAFVRQQAAQNTDLPVTTWWVVASAGGGIARNNAKVYADIPIYNTAGQLVAANGNDFYSAVHLAPISYDQFGDYWSCNPWTGMYPNGDPAQYLDFSRPATTYGVSDSLVGAWARVSDSSNRMENRSFYGLSEPIVAVPEPSTWVMGLAGLACGCWRMWRRVRA